MSVSYTIQIPTNPENTAYNKKFTSKQCETILIQAVSFIGTDTEEEKCNTVLCSLMFNGNFSIFSLTLSVTLSTITTIYEIIKIDLIVAIKL